MSKKNAKLTRTGTHVILEEAGRKFSMNCLYDVENAARTLESTHIEDCRGPIPATRDSKKYLSKRIEILQPQRKKP